MDEIFGTPGDDVLQPGPGDQKAFLLEGNDRFIWNPGDGNDTVNGDAGTDTLEFNGSDAVENFTVSGSGDEAELFRDVGNILMTLDSVERIELNGLGGDDVIDASELKSSKISLIVNGGTGDDDATLGAGRDTFIWNPGDGSDKVDGGGGTDTLLFNGSNAAETFTVTDTGNGAELFRNVGNILMELENVERIVVNGLGDSDLIDGRDADRRLKLIADGGDGDDQVLGGDAGDVLSGGAGVDLINGGQGNDRLTGGADTDRFQFSGGRIGDDRIEDWGRDDILALNRVRLEDGTRVTSVDQIDTNGDGLLNADDDPFEVVDGDLVLNLSRGSVTIEGLEQIGANLEIA